LIRDRELNSNGVFLSRVDVFSGGLETEECLFKYENRSGSLLGGVYFGIFIDILLIYDTFFLKEIENCSHPSRFAVSNKNP
jgi:hypothetical protein